MKAPNRKQPLGAREARLQKYDQLLERAKALVKGDDDGLKELIAAVIAGSLSDTQVESLITTASRVTGIKEKTATGFVNEAKEQARRREDATPAAMEGKRRLAEAEAKATKILCETETARLWEICKGIAESPALLKGVTDIAHRYGVVNEDDAITGAYLVASSRLLKRKALSYVRRGAAASGKNHLLTVVLTFFPAKCVIPVSSATPMALVYYRGDAEDGADVDRDEGDENALAHKIILVAEAAVLSRRAGGDEHPMTVMLRVLLSDGKLDHHIPIPQGKGGAPKTVHIKRNGPIVLLMTSAREDIEPEMLTRLLSSDADESGEQTRSIIKGILNPTHNPISKEEIERWIDFQRWLERDAPYEVVVPFRNAIAEAYTRLINESPASLQLRMRRDVTALIVAVEASAVVHKAQRKTETGRVIAEISDYEHAHQAFNAGMLSLYDLRPAEAVKAALEAVIAIAEEAETTAQNDGQVYTYSANKSYRITVEAVRKRLGVASKETAAQRLEKLVDLAFIEQDEEKRGKGRGSPRFYKILSRASGGTTPNVFPRPDVVAEIYEASAAAQASRTLRTSRTAVFGPLSPNGTDRCTKNQMEGEGSETAVQNVHDVREGQAEAEASRTSRTSRTAVFNPPPKSFSHDNGAERRGNAQESKDLTARERIDGARGAGAKFDLWTNGAGFTPDLTFVTDELVRNMLLGIVHDQYDALLDELKREARHGAQ
jgi:hypothetical protein